MIDVLEKIRKSNCKKYKFEEYDENVAIVTNLNGIYVFVEYVENEDCFVVFDGGFTTTECLDSFQDDDKIVEKMKKILGKYQINKVEESLYLDGKYENLEESIDRLVNAENEILYK